MTTTQLPRSIIALLISLISVTQAFSEEAELKANDTSSQTKVLLLTNSTFHIHGGSMTPFNGYCSDTGTEFKAIGSYQYLKSTTKGQRISPFLKGQVTDPRIQHLLKKEEFSYVVLVTRFTAFLNDKGADLEIEAFKKMHEQIVRTGARTVVSVSYVTRDETNDSKVQSRNLAMHKKLKDALDNTEIDGKKSPIILVPTGTLWSEGCDEFGVDSWFADEVHGTPLAQHASGCLFFTFITGKDPRKSAFIELQSNRSFPEKILTPEQAEWLKNRVWGLYKEQDRKSPS